MSTSVTKPKPVPGPRLEMFARHYRHGWHQWGDQVEPAPLQLGRC